MSIFGEVNVKLQLLQTINILRKDYDIIGAKKNQNLGQLDLILFLHNQRTLKNFYIEQNDEINRKYYQVKKKKKTLLKKKI